MVALTPAIKNYLRAISSPEESKVLAKATDLAKEFGVAPASVTEMIQKMAAEGPLHYAPYVEQSFLFAVEKLLVDFLGLGAPTACNEASKLELSVTDRLVNCTCKTFNYPTICPCGEPIFRDNNCYTGR